MFHNNNAHITYCSFSPPVPATKFYTCYKKEACCLQGCCINGPYQVYQVWYYWLLFLIIFGIISGASWLCKKPRAVPSRSVSRNVQTSSRNSCYLHPRCNRRRCAAHFSNTERRECNTTAGAGTTLTDYEDNIVLDRLFVSFRNRSMLGDPPSYSSILSPDYNNMPPPKFCPLYSYYGPPPTYSSMYKSTSDSSQVQQVVVNESVSNHNSSISGGSTIQIQIHTEEHGNRQTVDNNNANDGINVVGNSSTEVNNGNTNTTININNDDTVVNITTTNVVMGVDERNRVAAEGMENHSQSSAAPENV